jgi:peptidoglycan/xylan/chitin deacetylase (PgdA/CDA1 family)
MQALRDAGWRGTSMSEGFDYLIGQRTGRVAVITFDDGFVDNLEHALPILKDFGFSATCYFVADQIGGFNAWDHEELRVRKPLMNRAQIREWIAAGMGIGSHTLSHPHLTKLSGAEKAREIIDSRHKLEDQLGYVVRHFCFPYGDHDAECLGAVMRARYDTAVTTNRGRAKRGDNLLALPRLGNNGRRSVHRFRWRTKLWQLS